MCYNTLSVSQLLEKGAICMATYCPNPSCNRKLKLTDWRQTCPECGTNILYYKMEERLLEEADRVETSSAAFQKKVDVAKAAVVGNKMALTRFVLLFVPLFLLFLPLGRMVIDAPFIGKSTILNAFTVVTGISNMDFDALFAFLGDPVLSKIFLWEVMGIVGFVLVMLGLLGGAATSFLLESPKGFMRAVIFSMLGFGGTVFGAVALTQMGSASASVFPGALQTSIAFIDGAGLKEFIANYKATSTGGFMDFLTALLGGVTYFPGTGLYFVAAAFLSILGINIVIKSKGGIPIVHKQCYISGFPEEEVHAALAQCLTLEDMRRRRAEEEAAAEEAEGETEAETVEA